MLKYWHIYIFFFISALYITWNILHIPLYDKTLSTVNEYVVNAYICIDKEIFHSIIRIAANIRNSVIERRHECIWKNHQMSRKPFENSLQLFTIELCCGRQVERIWLGGCLPETPFTRQVRSKEIAVFPICGVVFSFKPFLS